jgi:hypothetical protein
MKPTRAFAGVLALVTAALAWFPPPCGAYDPEEIRAILLARPARLAPDAPSFVLAQQRRVLLNPGGLMQIEDHILTMVGGADPAARTTHRWTFRPEVEAFRVHEAKVHRATGEVDSLRSGAAQVAPCAAAGAEGYPGVADLVIEIPDPRPGDLIEIRVGGQKTYYHGIEQCFGEHRFAGADSIVESELAIAIPPGLPFRPRMIGRLPDPEIDQWDDLLRGRWLTGNLAPERPVARGLFMQSTAEAPDSASSGSGAVWYGFDLTWNQLVRSRSVFWRRALAEVPPEMGEAKAGLLALADRGEDPLPATVEWVNRRFAPLDLAAARLWYEPVPLSALLARGAAIPRDRALAIVWLLRQLGMRADVAGVSSRGVRASTDPADPAIPQQLDSWVVRVVQKSGNVAWVDVPPPGGRAAPLPPGRALLWTADPETPVLVEFPGVATEPDAPLPSRRP